MYHHNQAAETIRARAKDWGLELLQRSSDALFKVKDVMSVRVLTASPETLLADMAENMGQRDVSCSVVLDQGQVVGIVSEHDCLRAVAGNCGELYQLRVSAVMSSPVRTIGSQQSILEAGQAMELGGIRRLPVVDAGRLVGIITQTDLIRARLSVGAHSTVADIMSTDVVTLTVQSTVAQAGACMDRHRVSGIVAEQAGVPVGILSERDILRKVTGARRDPNCLPVETVMSSPIVTIDPSYSIFSAARLMDQRHLHRLVVMEGDRLCGMITQADIFRATLQELQAQERARAKRLEESSTMIFSLDRHCRTSYCNPALLRFLAVEDPGQIIHRPFLPERFWVNPQERARFLERLLQGMTQPEELALKTLRGDRVFVNVFCLFTEAAQGPQGVLHDITARKTAEQRLAAALQEAERANRELKAMQSQLVQNEKLACIGQLAAGVAHEMNTPVGFVASNFETLIRYVEKLSRMFAAYEGFVDLVATSGQDAFAKHIQTLQDTRQALKLDFVLEDIKDLFCESREGLKRVTSIVQNLRDFSRVDQENKLDDYCINDCIKSTLIVARNEIKYDAEVETDLGDIPVVPCHGGQINQVLLNILVNAAHAIREQSGREGRGTIRIKTYATHEQVVCEIQDNGPGIPRDKLTKIFDPFFTTKPAGKGTGLGLSVSHDIIVNKHKGKLGVDSTIGEGTKFTIALPIGVKENDEKEAAKNGKENSIICR